MIIINIIILKFVKNNFIDFYRIGHKNPKAVDDVAKIQKGRHLPKY